MKFRASALSIRIAAISFLLVAAVQAQESETKVKAKDLPAPVQKTVREQSKGAKIRGLSKEVENGQTFYEVALRVNGHGKDVLIDPTGAVVEVEEQVSLSSLPQPARTAIEQAAGKGKILDVEAITKGGSLEAYEAHIANGRKRFEVKVRPDGQVIKEN